MRILVPGYRTNFQNLYLPNNNYIVIYYTLISETSKRREK